MKTVKELHLLVGLPGSGKTTFSETYLDLKGRHRFDTKFKHGDIIDFDAIYKKAGFNEKLQINRSAIEEMKLKTITREYVILDGLFVSQDEYEWVLNLFINGEQYKNITFEKIIVDYWPEDKETCIWNDRGRRDYTSELSIGLLELDRPDVKAIEKKFNIKTKLEIHHIVRKPAYLVMAGENGFRELKDNRYLMSNTWSLGGVGRSWRDDSTYPISGEEPLEFDEFDRLYYFYYSYLTMGVKNIIDMQTIENLFSKFKIRIVDRISNIELEKLLKSSNCRFEKHHIDSLNQMKWILKTSEENTVKCNVFKLDKKIEKISNKEELNTKHI